MFSTSSNNQSIPDFHEIVLDGFGSIQFTQSAETTISLDGENPGMVFGADVRNGVLHVGTGNTPGKIVITTHPPVYKIASPLLDKITIKGAAKAIVHALSGDRLEVAVDGAGNVQLGELRLNNVRIRIGGAGKINASGNADVQDIEISGAGSFNGEDLIGKRAQVNINGAGKARVNATEELTISIGGVGSVTYLGNPRVEQRVGGLGRVKRA